MQKSVIKSSFIYSLKRTIPILVGFFPVGVAYGLMMSAAGYGVWWTAAASLFVYTGATQMLMVSFFSIKPAHFFHNNNYTAFKQQTFVLRNIFY